MEPDKIDAILSKGIYLGPDIFNWALTREQTLTAIKELQAAEDVAILGGDVLLHQNGRFSHNYDNWCCDPLPGESKKDYIARSIETTKNYVTNYKADESAYFALVPKQLV